MFDTIQPSIGEMFIGIGVMLFFLAGAYVIYLFARRMKSGDDLDIRYNVLQEILINKVAEKKGIDLDKEIEKRSIMHKSKFRKQLEYEVYEELFGDGKEKKK